MAAAKARREQIRRSRTLFVKEISQMVNDLDLLLDDFEVQEDKRNRGRLLERAVLLSIRGLKVLVQEPFVTSPTDYLVTMQGRLNNNPWAVQEELRHDSTTSRFSSQRNADYLATSEFPRVQLVESEALLKGQFGSFLLGG
jgi:hypothetical protein